VKLVETPRDGFSCPVELCAGTIFEGGCEVHGSAFARCDHCDAVKPVDELVHEAENRWFVCCDCVGLCVMCGERKGTESNQHDEPVCGTAECAREQQARHELWLAMHAGDREDDDIPFAETAPAPATARGAA
jgi:hypothetical protein